MVLTSKNGFLMVFSASAIYVNNGYQPETEGNIPLKEK